MSGSEDEMDEEYEYSSERMQNAKEVLKHAEEMQLKIVYVGRVTTQERSYLEEFFPGYGLEADRASSQEMWNLWRRIDSSGTHEVLKGKMAMLTHIEIARVLGHTFLTRSLSSRGSNNVVCTLPNGTQRSLQADKAWVVKELVLGMPRSSRPGSLVMEAAVNDEDEAAIVDKSVCWLTHPVVKALLYIKVHEGKQENDDVCQPEIEVYVGYKYQGAPYLIGPHSIGAYSSCNQPGLAAHRVTINTNCLVDGTSFAPTLGNMSMFIDLFLLREEVFDELGVNAQSPLMISRGNQSAQAIAARAQHWPSLRIVAPANFVPPIRIG